MVKALSIAVYHPKGFKGSTRGHHIYKCAETGEYATLTEWATELSKLSGATVNSVRSLILKAENRGHKAYDLTLTKVTQ